MIDYMPNAPLGSVIIDYQIYAHLWMMVPPYLRIRIPKLIFKASEHGYNINQLYAKTEPLANSYHCCLILIRDMDSNVFGALIDTMPIGLS